MPEPTPPNERALGIVNYLEGLSRLRSRPIRTVQDYDEVLWFNDVPREPGWYSRTWAATEQPHADVWLEVRKISEPQCPAAPRVCAGWYDQALLRDSSKDPALYPSIIGLAAKTETPTGPEEGSPSEEPPPTRHLLEDHPEITNAWHRYLDERWRPWQNIHTKWRASQEVYSKIFQIYQAIQREAENLELVLGIGLLVWNAHSSGSLRRHVVVADAAIEFQAERGIFTIGPAIRGSQLRVEFDMLDTADKPTNLIKTAEEGLKTADDDPWDRAATDPVLSSVAQSLHHRGSFIGDEVERPVSATQFPQLGRFPALILRKRSAKNVLEFLARIKAQLATTDEIPGLWADLCEIPETGNIYADDHLSSFSKKTGSLPGEVFLPLPSNEQQREIVECLGKRRGTVVQGPPGTGKSHTIANLICHLLASGKRVLVTAETPRALEVLQDKLPAEIRPLCVSLVGTDHHEQKALEHSVRGIEDRRAGWNERHNQETVDRLTAEISRLRAEDSALRNRLRDVREAESREHRLSDGQYAGTAQKIAQSLTAAEAELGWIPDQIDPDRSLVATSDELNRLRSAIQAITPDRRLELSQRRPCLSQEVPTPELFKKLCQDELTARGRLAQAASSSFGLVLAELSPQQFDSLSSLVEAVEQRLRPLMNRGEGWVKEALDTILAGQGKPVVEAQAAYKRYLDGLGELARSADEMVVADSSGKTLAELKADAEDLREHLVGGKSLGIWIFKPAVVKRTSYLTKLVKIDGRPCDSVETLDRLLRYLDVQRRLAQLRKKWGKSVAENNGTLVQQVAHFRSLVDMLDAVLAIEAPVGDLRNSCIAIPEIASVSLNGTSAILEFGDSCRWAKSKGILREATGAIDEIVERLRTRSNSNDWHPITQRFAEALKSRSEADFHSACGELQQLNSAARHLDDVDGIASRVRGVAPYLLRDIQASPDDPGWMKRLAKISEAWSWRRAKTWIEQFTADQSDAALNRKAADLEARIRGRLGELAAARAWRHCFQNMSEDHRRHLIAWEQAMRKLGKGHTKYAALRRREAQEHLHGCREAIPGWVMPLHRIFDTIDPAPEMFDVVIVDEASQCGPAALPLFYLARSMVVVGDDKQISPRFIGTNREDVGQLIREFLPDLEHRDSFDVETSLFHQAVLRFGNRIVLREHFRCMPEIIRFSNDLCYSSTPLEALRQYPPQRLQPLVSRYVADGYREGSDSKVINKPEAEALVRAVLDCHSDSRYAGKSFGVIALQGTAQARLIESLLLKELGVEWFAKRHLMCGNPYTFQGDERDVIFLSVVAATNERIGPMTQAADERSFNVAASRARDQMWLFHSVVAGDLNEQCLRRRLLRHFQDPRSAVVHGLGMNAEELERRALRDDRSIMEPPQPFDSWFEVDVALAIARRGYRVVPQYPTGGYLVDLMVEGSRSRLAVECDGDRFHGVDRYEADQDRQRKLERCGLTFWRVRGSIFYANPDAALASLWEILAEQEICPVGQEDPEPPPAADADARSGACAEAAVPDSMHDQSDAAGAGGVHTDGVEVEDDEGPVDEGEDEDESDSYSSGDALRRPDVSGEFLRPTNLRLDLPIYREWQLNGQRALPDPRTAGIADVAKSLAEIVTVEGPIVCARAYRLYVKAAGFRRAGKELVNALSKAMAHALRKDLVLAADVNPGGLRLGRIVRGMRTAPVIARQRGPRDFDEIPHTELAEVMKLIRRANSSVSQEELFRVVLSSYNLLRMTSSVKATLQEIVSRIDWERWG